MNLPGKSFKWFIENKESGLVVAVQELDVDDVVHIIRLKTKKKKIFHFQVFVKCLKGPKQTAYLPTVS